MTLKEVEELTKGQPDWMLAVAYPFPRSEAEWPNFIDVTGMPADYEVAVRKMIIAGARWIAERPGLVPCWDTDQRLEDACAAACPDCTGAMADVARCSAWRIWQFGWAAFIDDHVKGGKGK